MLKNILIAHASLAALLSPCLAQAQDIVSKENREIIVTVTREPLPVSKLGQAVDVLTDADIKSYQSLSIADLLARTTDLSLVRNGGPGAAAASSIRGAGADHTLYLLDGIALNDPSQVGGGTDLGILSTGDVSRVEVLRGPLSTLWGSGALGGIVSLTSRSPAQPLEGDLSVEGLDRYGALRAGVGGRTGKLSWRVFAGGQNDQGISAAAGGSEKDGFTQTQLSAKASYAFSEATTARLYLATTHNRSDIDGYLSVPPYTFGDTAEFSKSDTTLAALGLVNSFSNGEQTLSLNASQTDRNLYDPDGTPNFTARGRIASADYHQLYRLSDATRLLVGARYERDDMRTVSIYSPLASKRMTVSSLYGQVAQDVGPADVTLSARHDESSSFGGQDIAQAAISAPIGNGWRLHASAGQGVKVPSLYQLYGDYGNATLKPEKALSLDAGADYTFVTGQVSVTAFTRDVRDLIDFDIATFAYGNIARSKAHGVEVEWNRDLTDQWHVRGNTSFVKTRNESAGLMGKQLARKPETLANLDLTYAATQKLQLGLGLRFAGKSFDDAYNTVVLKAYSVADLRASYDVSSQLKLYARLENISDAQYQTAAGYAQLGRRLWLGVHTRFN